MSYSPVVTVEIAINAVNLTQQGFGTPIFICTHNQYNDRVREYSLLEEVAEDFGTTHNAYIAASQFFKNSPAPAVIKIGRRVGEIQAIPSIPSLTSDTTYNMSVISRTEGASPYSVSVVHNNVAIIGREAVCDAIVAALNGLTGFTAEFLASRRNSGDASIVVVTSLDDDETMTATTSATGGESGLPPTFTNSFVGTEAPVVSYASIKSFDDDFYFVTHELRPTTQNIPFLKALANLVEADTKIYFVSSDRIEDIDSEDINTSFFYDAFYSGLDHTVTFWHHQASEFVECYYVGYNAPFDAGTVTWCNLRVNGLPPSSQPNNTSKPLTTTQLGRLMDRKANFIQRDAGVNVIRIGTVASGEWIDTIRGVHWLTEDMTVAIKSLLFNQKGKKIPYTNQGIAQVREVIASSLQRAVNRTFLSSYTIQMPLLGQEGASYQDFVDRVLRNVKFTGILAGAIHMVQVNGQVTPPSDV